MNSNSFENAVARAKQLAAKLAAQAPGGAGPPPPSMPPQPPMGGQKRSFDDDEDYDRDQKRHQVDPFGEQLAAMRRASGPDFGNGKPPPDLDRDGDNGGQRGPTNGPYVHGLVVNGEKTLDIMIPGVKVGYVIGKGGEMIRNLQDRAQVKMTIFQQTNVAGDNPKQLRIVGAPDKVDFAKELVNDLLVEKELESMKVRTSKAVTNEYGSMRAGQVEVAVPPSFIGLVIGKGGESIKRIQMETGTKVQFDTNKPDKNGNKVCQISGPPDCVEQAKKMIQEILDNAAIHRNNSRLREGEEMVRMPVPANKTGTIIGRGGETIRALKQQCGCDIELDKNAKVGPNEDKVFIIRGPPDRIAYAQQLINDKISGVQNSNSENPFGASSGDYSWPGNFYQGQQQDGPTQSDASASSAAAGQSTDYAAWAAYYAQVYAQQGSASQQAAASGDGQTADYSKEWANYYRAYGMHKEAEMIENMAKNPTPPQNSNNSAAGESSAASQAVGYPRYNYELN